MKTIVLVVNVLILVFVSPIFASEITIKMKLIDGEDKGKAIGTIKASESTDGLGLDINLHDLPPGSHGIHLHQKPNCGPADKKGKSVAGLAAGGHFDPNNTNKHLGPYKRGHRGDIPTLNVDKNGKATKGLLAPLLRLKDLKGRSLVIHKYGDNYSDKPKSLGGGGPRIACGVI